MTLVAGYQESVNQPTGHTAFYLWHFHVVCCGHGIFTEVWTGDISHVGLVIVVRPGTGHCKGELYPCADVLLLARSSLH